MDLISVAFDLAEDLARSIFIFFHALLLSSFYGKFLRFAILFRNWINELHFFFHLIGFGCAKMRNMENDKNCPVGNSNKDSEFLVSEFTYRLVHFELPTPAFVSPTALFF